MNPQNPQNIQAQIPPAPQPAPNFTQQTQLQPQPQSQPQPTQHVSNTIPQAPTDTTVTPSDDLVSTQTTLLISELRDGLNPLTSISCPKLNVKLSNIPTKASLTLLTSQLKL